MAVIAVDCGGTNLAFGRCQSAAAGAPAGVVPTPREAAAIPAAVISAVSPLIDGSVRAIGIGAGAGQRMVLLVALGTGIGGGLVIDGEVERGRGFLGEIGHMVMDPSDALCTCGRQGCWEALVSGTSLGQAAREAVQLDPAGAVAGLVGAALAAEEAR